MSHWYDKLRGLRSLGALVDSPTSLAGLHEARSRHVGQFFTPYAVARFMWQLVEEEVARATERTQGGMASVLDTSVGSGRLLQFCDPEKHTVGGADVDKVCIEAVQEVFEGAGFHCTFKRAGMETLRAHGWTVAMLNPPFSIQLNSVVMEKYSCNTFGKLGPGTSAQSDYYALAHALGAASGVVALVPRSVAEKVWAAPGMVDEAADEARSRLAGRFDLPADSFRDEGAEVKVSVLVFGTHPEPLGTRVHEVVKDLEARYTLRSLDLRVLRSTKLDIWGLEDTGPSIDLPVTGSNVVTLGHSGRKLVFGFKCGFAKARVMNAVLRERISSSKDHRLPKGFAFAGQGQLDLEVHLLQDDPKASLQSLFDLVKSQGVELVVDQGLLNYFGKKVRELARAAAPMEHTVWRKDVGTRTIKARAKQTVLLDKSSWLTPVIKAGDEVLFERREDALFVASVGGMEVERSFEELDKEFECVMSDQEAGWVQVHTGKCAKEPDLAKQWHSRLKSSVVSNFLTWDFQRDDLVELMLAPRGAVVAWSMGLGKSRLAVALILLSGVKHGLITTEAYLVPELVEQIEGLGLEKSLWQVVEDERQLTSLRTINIISNARLGMTLRGQNRLTYAHKLRRRIGLTVSDEGEYLANPRSDRSKGLWRVSAKRRFVLTGTPVANTPRDVLPILSYVGGDATAAQPWGYWGAYLEANHRQSVKFATRGIEKFIERYVVLTFVVNEFAETLREGAKREIPSLRNVDEYRSMIAPFVKRRVVQEPAVALHVQIPEAREKTHVLPWTEDHLGHYIKVADEFASWMSREETKKKNLMIVLLRFAAVVRALNMPQVEAKHVRSRFHGVTSKQAFIVDRLEQLASEGKKVLTFAQSPDLAMLLARRLKAQCGLDPVVVHGKVPAAQRHLALKEKFRRGKVPVAIATFGVAQAGLNLPEVETVILANRMMTAKAERQAIARALRPETKHDVDVEYVHIGGSCDDYLGQMVSFKGRVLDAALDWATPDFEESDYVHMDTMLGRFLEGLAERRGLKVSEMKDMLKVAA